MENKIYQIQITLNDIKPKIWRRILIPSDLPLSDLHKIIQTTMGWTNLHLHQFIKDKEFYSTPMDDDDFIDETDFIDYKNIKVSDLLTKEKEKMLYEYDFGDDWMHNIILEKILPVDPNIKYPICIAGKMNCPPEDCGGPWGYSDLLQIIKQPDHEQYEDYIDLVGEDFDPKYFDKDEVNEMLQKENYGCDDFDDF